MQAHTKDSMQSGDGAESTKPVLMGREGDTLEMLAFHSHNGISPYPFS